VKASEKFLLVTAVAAIAVAVTSQEMTRSIYHGLHSTLHVYLGGIGFVLFMVACALALAAVEKFRNVLLKLFLWVFFFYNISLLIRGGGLAHPVPLWIRAAGSLAVVVLFLVVYIRVGSNGWRKIATAIAVSSAIFTISPVLISWAAPSGPARTIALDLVRTGDIHNYLVIILDETSPEYTTGMVRDLARMGLHVKSAEVAAAGTNTLNAIPSMLSTSRHDDIAPCTWTALCGTRNFKFGALNADWTKTDIVGFFHPYCAIRGLRSCSREESVFADSSSIHFGLFTLWCGQFNRGGVFSFCRNGLHDAVALDRARNNMTQHVDQAPFWQEGGLLFVHFPLPHPSMTRAFPSLKVEYEGNVAEAERMISRLSSRMMSTFGADFTLVITSDHPLRTERWCASPIYAKPGCAASFPVNRGRVPFILASPKPINVAIPATNVGMLSFSQPN
jgi:hypothetical protein